MMHMGKYAIAADQFSDLTAKDPGSTYSHLWRESRRSLGKCYMLDGHYKNAVKILHKLLLDEASSDFDKDVIRTRMELAHAHAYMGNFAMAQEEIRRARKALNNAYQVQVKEEATEKIGNVVGEGSPPTDLVQLHDQLCLAEARISLMCGDYAAGLLAIQIDLEDGQSQAHATANLISDRLRLLNVRKQRWFEARSMEKRLELFYREYGESDAAANIHAFLKKEDKSVMDQVDKDAQKLLYGRELWCIDEV